MLFGVIDMLCQRYPQFDAVSSLISPSVAEAGLLVGGTGRNQGRHTWFFCTQDFCHSRITGTFSRAHSAQGAALMFSTFACLKMISSAIFHNFIVLQAWGMSLCETVKSCLMKVTCLTQQHISAMFTDCSQCNFLVHKRSILAQVCHLKSQIIRSNVFSSWSRFLDFCWWTVVALSKWNLCYNSQRFGASWLFDKGG